MSDALTHIVTEALIAILMAVSGFGLSLVLARGCRGLLYRALGEIWGGFVASLVRYAVLGGTAYLIVQRSGTSGLLVVIITALTGAFAIGSERTASDIIAGIKLLLSHQYTVGDWVTIAGQRGRVAEVTLTYTALQNATLDKTIIPNSEAVNKIVINHSQIPGLPVSAIVPVGAEQCLEDVLRVLQKCALDFKPQLITPDLQPSVSVGDIVLGKVNYKLTIFVPEEARDGGVEGALMLAAMRALVSGGIPVG